MRYFHIFTFVLVTAFQITAIGQRLAESRTSSFYTFIYKLTAEQANVLYRDIWDLENAYLNRLHDIYPTDSTYAKQLPVGHYLFVSAKDGSFSGELQSVNNVNLKLLTNHRDLMMVFYDSTGKELPDVKAKIRTKQLRFDPKTKTFRHKKSNMRGIISVVHEGHTSYFEIERQHNNGFLLRTGRKILRSFPVKDLISPVFYLKNNIQNVVRGGHFYPPPIFYKITRPFRPSAYTGFIAFNKPMYKPGDTIKLKAFITNRKGKPFKKDALLNLTSYSHDFSSRTLATIKPFRDGAFKYEFKLTDSLKLRLDNTYRIEFSNRKRHILIAESFRFEDYELKSNVYSVRSEENEDGKPAVLYLKGTDSNDMPLFDARAEIVVKPSIIEEHYQNSLFVKDTLWFYQTKLEAIGETRITLPDSVMPNAMLEYTAVVSFFNSENERVVKDTRLSFDKKKLPVAITLENDTIMVHAFQPGKELHGLKLAVREGSKTTSKAITLPHREKINYFVDAYEVSMDNKRSSLVIHEEADQLQALASRTVDSLFISTENPRKILFRYFLFRNQQLIDNGKTEHLLIKRKCNTSDRYSLSIQYVWAGQSSSKEYDIPFNKTNLRVKIDHAPIVYPGENTAFKISVKDAFGVPVSNADLTAYAITKKFSSQNDPAVPSLARYKRPRVIFNSFNLKRSDTDILKALEYSCWKKILGLDSITYYKFRFPENGYFEDRSKNAVTQFAPFVIGFGIETVAAIYVDDQPVYFEGVETVQPYSFEIKPGKHSIALRIRNALLTINNVKIDSAEKLIFSVNRYKLPANCTLTEMPYTFTEEESNKLSRYFIKVKMPTRLAYMNQGSRYHMLTSGSRYTYANMLLSGPFYPGNVSYFERGGFHLKFYYEPFSSYEFKENILTIRDFKPGNVLNGYRPNWYSPSSSLQDEVFTKQSVEEYWNNHQDIRVNAFRRFPEFNRNTKRAGKLTLNYVDERLDQFLTKATFIVNLDNPDEYFILPHIAKSESFHEGHYQAVIILQDNQYIKADSIVIRPFGTNYYDLNKSKPLPADSLSKNIIRLIKEFSSPENYLLRQRELQLQQLRSLYYQESSAAYLFTHHVSGRVTDEDGNGVPGASVIVKGTAMGTTTNMEGYYSVKCPSDGQLVFSFIGYQTQEEEIDNSETINVTLPSDITQLSEVVVVAYSASEKKSLSASMAMASRAPGLFISGGQPGTADSVSIHIRGLTSVNGNRDPLVILDGRIVKLSDVNRSLITAVESVSSADALGIYGSQAANGVLLMSTKAGATKTYLNEMSKGIIPATAVEELPGNALRKNFRDYAFWQPTLRTDENGTAEFHATFPDDITGWNTHVLAMSTKRRTGQTVSTIQSYKPLLAQIMHPHFLVEGDRAAALGKITNYSREKYQLTRRIKVNENLIDEAILDVQESKIDSILLTPAGLDSTEVEYTVAFNTYRDGELRKIPVMRKGTLETTGQFFALDSDTTFTLRFPATGNPMKIYAETDLLDVLLDEMDYLKQYTYECNEQLASKLKALLLEKNISAFRKTKFTGDHVVQKIIRKLTTNQNDDGSWSWWQSGEGELWITMHVTKTLLRAEKEGYKTALDKEQLIGYFERQLFLASTRTRLEVMNFLAEQGQTLHAQALVDSIKVSRTSTLHEKLLAERLSQSMGHDVDWKWLNTVRSQTIKGNFYWGVDKTSVYDNPILNSLLVYEIATRDDSPEVDLTKIENYLLEQRRRHWRNTYESALILESILPRILKNNQSFIKANLQLGDALTQSISSFPQAITASSGDLTVTKTGSGPVYFTAYMENWNTAPAESHKDFTIVTSFDTPANVLKAGKPVTLTIDLEVKNEAEYVMIEVPIPAGCSYQTKQQSRRNGEVHREYYHHKTNIYCKYLKKGKYNYTIELLPRYSGHYTFNPAKVECMYFPTLYGRERLKEVTIK